MNARRFNFDLLWHDEAQQTGMTPEKAAAYFAGKIARRRLDVVIDGWWTWSVDWWRTNDDNTLQILRDNLRPPVKLICLPMSDDEAFFRFKQKWKSVPRDLPSHLDYEAQIPCRQAALQARIDAWVK